MKTYNLLMLPLFFLYMCTEKKEVTELKIATEGLYTHADFHVGASISTDLLRSNAVYQTTVLREFNSLTPENAMKIGYLHPAQNTFNFKDADYLVAYAKSTGKRVHGHTLVWHVGLPDWINNFNGNTAAWEQLLKNHIQAVAAHFKGKVTSWDVVNEAFEDDGTLRKTIWQKHLGDDYIARCFQYAHEADPDALLFYNDYGHEYSIAKRTAIINLVNGLKSRGITINGVGLQMHTNSNVPDQDIASAITSTATATGLMIHVSELDISMNPNNNKTLTYTPEIAALQAAKYKAVVKAYNALPSAQKFGITTWDVSDADSWIPGYYSRKDWPLLFDNQYQPKAAYQGFIDGLK